MKSVSIVIPNWNGASLLEAYLPSVRAAAKKYRGKVEVIVVDDASTDRSAEVLRKNFPKVNAVFHEKNLGFGKACWTGATTAQNDILLLLNSDVEVEVDFITPLVEHLDDPDIFATVPVVFDDRGEPWSIALFVPYLRRGMIRNKRRSYKLIATHGEKASGPWYSLYPIGCSFAALRSRFLELGGFDELYHPFYFEDQDLGICAWRRGWSCQIIPQSRVWHQKGGTINRSFKNFRVRAIHKRNRYLFHWKNLTGLPLLARHFFFLGWRIFYRLLRLDALPMLAVIFALPAMFKALQGRVGERKAARRTLEEIFTIIDHAWQRNANELEGKEI